MITLNLLPKESRRKKTVPTVPAMKIAIGVGVLFALFTIYFYIDYLRASIALKKINAEWAVKQPEILSLSKLQEEVQGTLKQEVDFLNHFVTSERALTSMLIWASEYLPDNSWLTELKLERDEKGNHFFLKGLSLPSKGQSGIEKIEAYLHQLKEKIPDSDLNLTTSRQANESVELTQFIANFNFGGSSVSAEVAA